MNQEKAFIQALKNKEEEAFNQLIALYQPMISRVIYKIVSDKDETQDLVQEVFIQVWESIAFFKEESSLKTWIYRLGINKALNYLEKKDIRMAISFHTWFSEKKPTEGLSSSNESTIANIFRNEDQNAISAALKLLPAQQRAAFVLSKQEGLSNPEIATVLNTSISAVESLVFRAKQRLVKELLPYYQNKIS